MQDYVDITTNMQDRKSFEEAYNIFYAGVDLLGDPQDYSEINLLGQGSFGKVYQFKKRNSRGSIVVKVISKAKSPPGFVREEISVLKRLRRSCEKYVLCYKGAFEDSRNYYILTEYLGNYITLWEYRSTRHLTRRDKEKIIQNLVMGLQLIHTNGIAHRDIKPENIMINPATLDIKYIDFGGSCDIPTCIGSIYTVPYMAPELLGPVANRPRTLSQWMRADLWSLAETIWEILIGDPREFIWTNSFLYHDRMMRRLPSRDWSPAERRVFDLLEYKGVRVLDREAYVRNFIYNDPLVPETEGLYAPPLFRKRGQLYEFDLESLFSLIPEDRTYLKKVL